MMARLLAYALNAQEGIAFTRGLSEVDEPDVWVKTLAGDITLWIDLGQPDETRVRRACHRAAFSEAVARDERKGASGRRGGRASVGGKAPASGFAAAAPRD